MRGNEDSEWTSGAPESAFSIPMRGNEDVTGNLTNAGTLVFDPHEG